MSLVGGQAEKTGIRAEETPPLCGKTILLVSHENMPSCLIYALENEFPWVQIEHVTNPQLACGLFDKPVALIITDGRAIKYVEVLSLTLHAYHPSASIVLMMDDSRDAVTQESAWGLPFLRGILPMNTKLDIWLSIVRLMLNGGEYFPRSCAAKHHGGLPGAASPPAASAHRPRVALDGSSSAHALTARELEILEMVSRGCQNKVIASRLKLSESTVKIHLHNIIRKLGVHNRTGAANFFWSSQERVDHSAVDKAACE